MKQPFNYPAAACACAVVCALSAAQPAAAIEFTLQGGGAECVYAEWTPVKGAEAYTVSYSGEGLNDCVADAMLVRQYGRHMRVDIPGLKAGSYTIAVKAVDSGGVLLDEGTSGTLEAWAHVREGFAFTGGNVPGAYNLDGTLKDGAEVIYVTALNANTVTRDIVIDKKGTVNTATGLAAITEKLSKGYHPRPIAFRVIGTVDDTQFAGLKDGNYFNFQGFNATDRTIRNITVEGIGSDAALKGYGICLKRAHNLEIRNLAIMLFGDDAVSMDTDNSNIWVHNIDFFYGKPGSDADQVKGDGSIDIKTRSTDITISHNHFFDSGKVMGCGGATGETENLRISYHHNWFDHCDSRCPRLHYVTAHIYNNYYDGVSVYSIGNTTESSAFIESNCFRGCKRQIMTSGQGTDKYNKATGQYDLKGTFSGQAGGMNKAYNNIFTERECQVVWHTEDAVQFDAYLAVSRDEKVPDTFKSFNGAWPYSNFDTAPEMYPSTPDPVDEVPSRVTARAGRLQGGDLKWQFDNAVDDEDHDVNLPLKAAVTAYAPALKAVQGESPLLGSTAIAGPWDDTVDPCMDIYDMHGRKVAAGCTGSMPTLPSGLYIVRQGGKTFKRTVR